MTNYNGKKLVERSDWVGDLEEVLEVGCYVSGEIVWELIDAVPPRYFSRSFFQVGEPYSMRIDDEGKTRNTYTTFILEKLSPNDFKKEIYKYVGHCFAGEVEERGKEIQYV